MVVDAEGKVAPRNITVGSSQGAHWVVLDGLKAGEQVMVDGFQKLQMMPPGTAVKAVPWQPAGAASAAGAWFRPLIRVHRPRRWRTAC